MVETPYPPIEPPPTTVILPSPRLLRTGDMVAVSRTMDPSLVLMAYRQGVFPWPVRNGMIPWVSPDPRAVFPLEVEPDWPRSLRKTLRKGVFRVSANEAFDAVIDACGSEREGGTWITSEVLRTYRALHRLGWAHSIEVWDRAGALVGGLYGMSIGGAFAGESMFHRQTDASKVAFVALVERLRARGYMLLDAQVPTEHLLSLGCVTLGRGAYLDKLDRAKRIPCRFAGEQDPQRV